MKQGYCKVRISLDGRCRSSNVFFFIIAHSWLCSIWIHLCERYMQFRDYLILFNLLENIKNEWIENRKKSIFLVKYLFIVHQINDRCIASRTVLWDRLRKCLSRGLQNRRHDCTCPDQLHILSTTREMSSNECRLRNQYSSNVKLSTAWRETIKIYGLLPLMFAAEEDALKMVRRKATQRRKMFIMFCMKWRSFEQTKWTWSLQRSEWRSPKGTGDPWRQLAQERIHISRLFTDRRAVYPFSIRSSQISELSCSMRQ